jgi:putative membrane protein
MRRVIPHLACIALVFSFSMAFAQNSNNPQEMPSTSQQTRSTKSQSTNKKANFDQHFVREAAEGNMAEIQLAKLAQQKATDPQVKDLAKTIEQDHTQAQSKLEQVAQSQNVTMPAELPQKMQDEQQKLSSLSGQQFDHAYVQTMIRDHKKDIKEFQKAEKMASDSGVRQYANSTLPDLQKHLQMAEQAAGQGAKTQAQE